MVWSGAKIVITRRCLSLSCGASKRIDLSEIGRWITVMTMRTRMLASFLVLTTTLYMIEMIRSTSIAFYYDPLLKLDAG